MLELSKNIFCNLSRNYKKDYSVLNSLIYRIMTTAKILGEEPIIKMGNSLLYLLNLNILYEKKEGSLNISFSLFDYTNYYNQRRNEPQNKGRLFEAKLKEESIIVVKVNYRSKTPGFFNVRKLVVSTKNDLFEEIEDGYKNPMILADRLDVISFEWCDENLGTNTFKFEKEFKCIC